MTRSKPAPIAADFDAVCRSARQINRNTLCSLGEVERVVAFSAIEHVIGSIETDNDLIIAGTTSGNVLASAIR